MSPRAYEEIRETPTRRAAASGADSDGGSSVRRLIDMPCAPALFLDAPCACTREPGDDDDPDKPRAQCAACAEDDAREEGCMTTVGSVLAEWSEWDEVA